MSKRFLVHRGSLSRACLEATVNTSLLSLSRSLFGGCYWKLWLEAPIVYSVLPFSRRPSHDNTAGVAGKAGQEFHRSPAHRQDDGWMSQAAN